MMIKNGLLCQFVIAVTPRYHPQDVRSIIITVVSLPERFRTLTWVEGQVCAIYRSTAFVARLHYINDPKHPYVLHGNTCAFEQDAISTANTLPRAPCDMCVAHSITQCVVCCAKCMATFCADRKLRIPQ